MDNIVERESVIMFATVQVIDTTCFDRSELLGKENAQGFVDVHHY